MTWQSWGPTFKALGQCLFGLFLAAWLLFMVFTIYLNVVTTHQAAVIRREGMAARFNDVPAAANPYADEGAVYRHAWYDGWMEIERLKK